MSAPPVASSFTPLHCFVRVPKSNVKGLSVMKKLVPLFVVCLAATVVAALAFVNNCVVIVRWWQAFLAVGGDTSALTTEVTGILPWLDWAAVDHSGVTTFIPFLGFLMMTLSAGRLLRGACVRGEEFPFFKGSDQLNVALGLFGTLWGIIVIGYFKLDTVTMADLMQCLHTALFSTLMAVVWVFMIDRPLVRPFFLKLATRANLLEIEDSDLAAAVDALIVRLGKASDAFDRRQATYEKAFAQRQAAFEKTFYAQQKEFERVLMRGLEDLDAACKKRVEAYEREFELRQKEYVETFRRRLDELQTRTAEASARAEAAEKRLAAVTNALRA